MNTLKRLLLTIPDLPRKPPPPPPYEEHDRYRAARNVRNYPPRRRDDYERDHMDRHYRERRYSDSSNNTSGRDRYSDEKDDSFVQADDDHPQENFVERIIEPRVHPKSAGKVNRSAKTGQDDGYDSIENVNAVRNTIKKTNSEIQCNKESDSEGSPETESEVESSEEESSHSEGEEQDPQTSLYAKPDKTCKKKRKENKSNAGKQTILQPKPTTSVPFQARPSQGMVIQRATFQGYPMMPSNQPSNPSIRFMPPVGQIVRPAFPVPNQFNPVGHFRPVDARLSVPGSSTLPNQSHAVTQQNLPGSQPKPLVQQINNPNEAPKYSYLVNRGYDTGRTSPVSTSTSYSQQSYVLDDSAVNIDLGSGVELMKRTTEV